VFNALEAGLVCAVVDCLVRCGAAPADIGVITPYKAQLQVSSIEIEMLL